MAARSAPKWKQAFDIVEKTIGPRLNAFARSEEFATLAALNRRGQVEVSRRLEHASRRALHVMNLPAGSDMNRLLTQIAHLEREVRELRKQLGDRADAEVLAALAARRGPEPIAAASPVAARAKATSKAVKHGRAPRSSNGARTDPS